MKDKVKQHTRAQRRAQARAVAHEARKRELAQAVDKAYYKGHDAGFRSGRDSVLPTTVIDRDMPPRVWIGPKEHSYRVHVTARDWTDCMMLREPPSEISRYGAEIELRADVEALRIDGVIIQWPRWTVARVTPLVSR